MSQQNDKIYIFRENQQELKVPYSSFESLDEFCFSSFVSLGVFPSTYPQTEGSVSKRDDVPAFFCSVSVCPMFF